MPVVDASLVIDWVAPGADGAAVRLLNLLVRAEAPLLAPRLLLEEVAEALALGVEGRRWSVVDAEEAYALLRRLPVQLADVPADLDRAWELSRSAEGYALRGLVYVAMAERLAERLLTADRALRRQLRRLELRRA